MSANRKLLTEIQQVLKKVEEGVLLFDDIWEKVYSAAQQSLKEKYESDLKKEIKKLQRLRDQIKTWLGSSDVKDKSQLTESRKLIETKMEQFKICEKDTKTKAYSNGGLAREAKLDPKDADREDKRVWINDCLERLNDLIENIEVDIEKFSSGRGKGKNKEQIEKFENRKRKNKFHIARLEQILKLMENYDIDPSKCDSIKDDVEYYIESANEDDGALGVDDEFDIYEDLQLDTLEAVVAAAVAAAEAEAALLCGNLDISPHAGTGTATSSTTANSTDTSTTASDISSNHSSSNHKSATSSPVTSSHTPHEAPPAIDAASHPAVNPPQTKKPAAPQPQPSTGKSQPSPRPAGPSQPTKPSSQTPPTAKYTPPTAQTSQSQLPSTLREKAAATTVTSTQPPTAQPTKPPLPPPVLPAPTPSSWAQATALKATPSPIPSPVPSPPPPQPTPRPADPVPPAVLPAAAPSPPPPTPTPPPVSSYSIPITIPFQSPSPSPQPLPKPSPIPSPTDPSSTPQVLTMLRQSMLHSPENLDCDRQSFSSPRNPYHHTPPSYPSQPPSTTECNSLFEHLPMDSLFFSFYYQPSSYQQHLAAKQLKKHSWRFHKKYMTWFQRHEEPLIASDEFEEGTYVYFDYESGWCQRIKSEFKFEYAYLEDELPISGGGSNANNSGGSGGNSAL